ncbi:MAG: LytTR family DNA-binding domain-containing protein [Flavobacterium nitrogenifigens]|uniref:Two component transcriptional regulator, LytTR family n=1 Tax=Flavobacterium nitrogenifigens TaxID=1617283 RepID=A0A521BF44_9FLAO|nr:LytTR family DNA-binding domain-containing protein [Flavobacterium nitrogenifigens]KAF2337463.1 response regulator transcription factor [Flavobacterium nitrogenifigens]MDQ8012884.1 LytTR family DNA-binding domain-containing protein [Flavobacterium nitrogenifigens]SMO45727.1 two component transcriptional regulator, LytTR family [Flavobacterium nitrogenifigens]
MKILIVEDESINASRLKRLLEELEPNCEILGIIDTVVDTVAWLNSNPTPDLITMDIRLADGLSFAIFDEINITCPVIFTTAYDEYAIRAFKVNSIDYLMKPIEKNELEFALTKFKSLNKNESNVTNIAGILKELIEKPVFRMRFLVTYRDGYKSVDVSDIDFIYSEFKTSNLFLKSGVIISIPQTMEELEQELDPNIFFRANRQFFIRAESIKSIANYFNAKLKIQLKLDPEREVIISREKTPFFKQWMDR